LVVGRELQRHYGQESQVVLTTPILEGLDGIQKMSKSLGNAIGISEPPLEIYGKIMSISDDMMWRYYELLTDVQIAEIEKMKRETHPMEAKKDLAGRIVTDFHSAEAARKAGEDWAKQFQKDEVPEEIQKVQVRFVDVCSEDPFKFADVLYTMEWPIRIDKLLSKAGLVGSNTEGTRKIKEGAVRVNGSSVAHQIMKLRIDRDIITRVGRNVKSVRVYV